MNAEKHDDLSEAAKHLQELRERGKLIRDCPHLTPAARAIMLREHGVKLLQATTLYRRLCEAHIPEATGTFSRVGRYRSW
jgi:hypothetical protein